MIIIDGTGAVLGRLASFVAKNALKGEEIIVLNCEKVIISGNKKTTEREFFKKRSRYGHSQKGPIHSKVSEKIVKRVIRGMLPDYRQGRGALAFKKIKCFNKTPLEYSEKEKINMESQKLKYGRVKEFSK